MKYNTVKAIGASVRKPYAAPAINVIQMDMSSNFCDMSKIWDDHDGSDDICIGDNSGGTESYNPWSHLNPESSDYGYAD